MKPFVNTVRPQGATKAYRCPCCQNLTLHGRGQDEICPVCYWHDDGQDDHDAELVRGGPNGDLSLAQARESFELLGAKEERLVRYARNPLPDELA